MVLVRRSIRLGFLCVLCFVSADGFRVESDYSLNATRYKRQNACKVTEMQCKSGECTAEDNICDGKVDCKDGSDETSNCAKNPCPAYLFRCAYGACINSDYVCDGKKDCKDNSDETQPRCKDTNSSNNCEAGQHQCKSGQCIDDINLCDGVANCEDGSDETVDVCGSVICPPFTFKCAYGACINSDNRCNGISECLDSSDENCDAPSPVTPVIIDPVTKGPPVVVPVVPKGNECLLPDYPTNGKWTLFGPNQMQPGQVVSENSILKFQCNAQYKLFPENSLALCSKQWNNLPICIKTCSSIQATDNLSVYCDLHGNTTSCTNPYDGTRAKLACSQLFEDPGLKNKPFRYCRDGSWDTPLPKCEPVCGLKSVDPTKLVIGGFNAVRGDYPWQVAIYRHFEHICGGSIISPKFTLTAAHCFESLAKEIYLVAAGKYYRSYNSSLDDAAQFSKINEIIIHEEYKDGYPYYSFDIALLVLQTPFKITRYVLPVCLDKDNNFDHSRLVGQVGIVTGWGYTKETGTPSEVLKYLEVDYKTRQTCKLPMDFLTYYFPYTNDKLCAGLLNEGQSACQGDSGGGLVFPERNRYYIRGIVSIGPQRNGNCDSRQLTLYTQVAYHTDFIDRKINSYPEN